MEQSSPTKDQNPNGFQREIKINGRRLEEVENFKYLGAIISNKGSKPKILSRIAQTTEALSRLKIIWRDKNISLAAEIKRRIQAFEMRCYRRLLNISYKDHVTNEEVRNRIQNAIGVHDDLLTMVKKRKQMVWPHLKILGHGEDNSAGDSERSKKKRKPEEEMER